MNKWDCIKLKSFCTTKETVTRFTAHRMGENLCQPLIQQGTNIQNIQGTQKTQPPKNQHPSEKWAHELNREFSKKEVKMASKYMKKCVNSLAMKEIQIKITLRFHLIPVRMARIKGNNKNKCWQGCGETGILIHC
jgi:hypothetical protein